MNPRFWIAVHCNNDYQKAAIAQNTPPPVLRFLADRADPSIRAQVARNTAAPEDTLHQLAKDDDNYVRNCVAGNVNTPPDVLHILARDISSIRCVVATNPSTRADTLHMLTTSKDRHNTAAVTTALLSNLNLPGRSLRRLASVKPKAVAEHPNTPTDVLLTLVAKTKVKESVENYRIRGAAINTLCNRAADKTIKPAQLTMLAELDDTSLRSVVARQPGTPTATLETLAQDENFVVRNAAQQHLAVRQRPTRKHPENPEGFSQKIEEDRF